MALLLVYKLSSLSNFHCIDTINIFVSFKIGDILVNGRPRDASFNRLVSYVMKDDVHLPLLTVRETLTFSARLRVDDADKSDEALRVRVDMNIKMLGLKGCANTIIGNESIHITHKPSCHLHN
jgi:ABC-type multidrug transport system ATPase subunit